MNWKVWKLKKNWRLRRKRIYPTPGRGIRELVDNLRNICRNLRPPTIDNLGLGAALQSLTLDWTTRTNVNVDLNIDPKIRAFTGRD